MPDALPTFKMFRHPGDNKVYSEYAYHVHKVEESRRDPPAKTMAYDKYCVFSRVRESGVSAGYFRVQRLHHAIRHQPVCSKKL